MFNFIFNFFYSVISFLVAAFFIILGILAIYLPWSTLIRTNLITLILENSIAMSLFGFGIAIIGFTMLVNLYQSHKKRYYFLRSGKRSIVIDEEILGGYLNSYWQVRFPGKEVPHQLHLKGEKIRIIADLPKTPKPEQKELMTSIQEELQEVFFKVLGYSHEIQFAFRFQ